MSIKKIEVSVYEFIPQVKHRPYRWKFVERFDYTTDKTIEKKLKKIKEILNEKAKQPRD